MNRRQMVFLPGAALLAGEAYAQTQSDVSGRTPTSSGSTSPHKAMKATAKYGRAKYSYKIPKNEKQQTKYITFLSTLLSLTPTQQQQAASIFSAAITAKVALRPQVQAAHYS